MRMGSTRGWWVVRRRSCPRREASWGRYGTLRRNPTTSFCDGYDSSSSTSSLRPLYYWLPPSLAAKRLPLRVPWWRLCTIRGLRSLCAIIPVQVFVNLSLLKLYYSCSPRTRLLILLVILINHCLARHHILFSYLLALLLTSATHPLSPPISPRPLGFSCTRFFYQLFSSAFTLYFFSFLAISPACTTVCQCGAFVPDPTAEVY